MYFSACNKMAYTKTNGRHTSPVFEKYKQEKVISCSFGYQRKEMKTAKKRNNEITVTMATSKVKSFSQSDGTLCMFNVKKKKKKRIIKCFCD